MKVQTEGIILRYFRYGDSSMIAHLYTKDYGRVAFLFKGVNSRSAKRKAYFLQPLALIELPIDYRPQKEMYSAGAAQLSEVFQSIPFQQVKSSVAFFLAEFLSNVLQANEADEPLFSFLREAILVLDRDTDKMANFHLTFLVKLTGYLGIQPELTAANPIYLNVELGSFMESEVESSLSKEESELWKSFQNNSWGDCDAILLSREQRNVFLEKLLQYYAYHLQDLGQMKSLKVLKEIFQ